MSNLSSGGLRAADSADRVARVLAVEIIDGTHRPGARLVAGEIADRLQVSRVPVREAFRSLARLGLADVVPNKGATVLPEKEPADLVPILEGRLHLEPWAMSYAARNRTNDDLARIAESLDAGLSATLDGDALTAIRAHANLLEYLADAIHQRAAEAALRPLYAQTGAIVTRTIGHIHRAGWDSHRKILHALQRADADAAQDLTKAHLGEMITRVAGT
ncbi:GntR family transcriptional regulator [Leucobacter sp. UCMA 4100]|uniref:GntR family transcriptional regulator n=1 Tax=Micrococcales TaxID=85006 RepID=UPI0022EAB5A8|nr:GntR family transcriptional regulator [Leucobacter sp. UCMA 4100]MDA3147145.1 GntR family transcriptional regulator [Leucobacter sp. UCMA 4100]